MRRPDLLEHFESTDEDRRLIREIMEEIARVVQIVAS